MPIHPACALGEVLSISRDDSRVPGLPGSPLAWLLVLVVCTLSTLACLRSCAQPTVTTRAQAYLKGFLNVTKGAHFNSFDSRHDFPLLPTARDLLQPGFVVPYDHHLVHNSSDITVLFNTSGTPTMTVTNVTCAARKLAGDTALVNATCVLSVVGYLRLTEGNTETGLFNFRSVYLGPPVNVTVTGNRALVIISRSSAIYDTNITVLPGTLGVRACVVTAHMRARARLCRWGHEDGHPCRVCGCGGGVCARAGVPTGHQGTLSVQQQLLRRWQRRAAGPHPHH
jgi:hypothetical protein